MDEKITDSVVLLCIFVIEGNTKFHIEFNENRGNFFPHPSSWNS